MLWVASQIVSATACAIMSALDGWKQLTACLLVLLWAAVCSSSLEYAMACIVHDTMDMHLEAGHHPVRDSYLATVAQMNSEHMLLSHIC